MHRHISFYIFLSASKCQNVKLTILYCSALFGAYGNGRISIILLIARNEAICQFLLYSGLLRASQWRSEDGSWHHQKTLCHFKWDTTVASQLICHFWHGSYQLGVWFWNELYFLSKCQMPNAKMPNAKMPNAKCQMPKCQNANYRIPCKDRIVRIMQL